MLILGDVDHPAGFAARRGSTSRTWCAFDSRKAWRITDNRKAWDPHLGLVAEQGYLTRRRIRRGVFRSILDFQQAINRYIREHNDDPRPFVWTSPADPILGKINWFPAPSFESAH